jgi:hypothetical protein
MIKGFACAIFERGGLRKSRTDRLTAHQIDDLCNRFNVTRFEGTCERAPLNVCDPHGIGHSRAKTG